MGAAGGAELWTEVGDFVAQPRIDLLALALLPKLIVAADQTHLHVAARSGDEERTTTVALMKCARCRANEEPPDRGVAVTSQRPFLGAGGVIDDVHDRRLHLIGRRRW